MKTWTTTEEYVWLTSKLPEWTATRKTRKVQDWLITTANHFLKAFPEYAERDVHSTAKVSLFATLDNVNLLALLLTEVKGLVWKLLLVYSQAEEVRSSTSHPRWTEALKTHAPCPLPSIFLRFLQARIPPLQRNSVGLQIIHICQHRRCLQVQTSLPYATRPSASNALCSLSTSCHT